MHQNLIHSFIYSFLETFLFTLGMIYIVYYTIANIPTIILKIESHTYFSDASEEYP